MTEPVYDEFKYELLRQTCTVSQSFGLLSLLDKLNAASFKTTAIDINALEEDFKTCTWFSLVAARLGTHVSNISQEVASMSEVILKAPKITLEIPFEPTDSFKNNIYSLLLANSYKGFLLDIKVDESVVCGAKVFVNGHYIDATLAPRVRKFLEETNALNGLI